MAGRQTITGFAVSALNRDYDDFYVYSLDENGNVSEECFEGHFFDALPYDGGEEPPLPSESKVKAMINGKTAECGTLSEIFRKIDEAGDSTADYVITISESIGDGNLVFPKKAHSVTLITGNDAVITTTSPTLAPKCDLVINADIVNKNEKPLNITVPADKSLTLGKPASYGDIKGGRGSSLRVSSKVTALSVQNFDSITADPGLEDALTVKEKIKGIGALSGALKLDAGSSAALKNVGGAHITLVQYESKGKKVLPGLTIDKIEDGAKFVITVDGDITSNTSVSHITARTIFRKKMSSLPILTAKLSRKCSCSL